LRREFSSIWVIAAVATATAPARDLRVAEPYVKRTSMKCGESSMDDIPDSINRAVLRTDGAFRKGDREEACPTLASHALVVEIETFYENIAFTSKAASQSPSAIRDRERRLPF